MCIYIIYIYIYRYMQVCAPCVAADLAASCYYRFIKQTTFSWTFLSWVLYRRQADVTRILYVDLFSSLDVWFGISGVFFFSTFNIYWPADQSCLSGPEPAQLLFLVDSDMLAYSRDRLLSLCPPVISPSELLHRVHRVDRGCRPGRCRRVRLTSLNVAVLSDEPRVSTVIIGNRLEWQPTQRSGDVKQAFCSGYEQDVKRDSSITGLGVVPCRGYLVDARDARLNSLQFRRPTSSQLNATSSACRRLIFPLFMFRMCIPKSVELRD